MPVHSYIFSDICYRGGQGPSIALELIVMKYFFPDSNFQIVASFVFKYKLLKFFLS